MLRKCLIGLALGALLGVSAQAQTVDEIIAKNAVAKGGMEKLKAIETVKFTGKITIGPGMEAPFTMDVKRPNKMRTEFEVQGMTGVQAFDGETAWNHMPFMGKKDPEQSDAEDTKEAAEQADMIDGPLVDYKAKGHTVELIGKEDVEGTQAYKLKLTLKGGTVRFVYLDAEYFLELKVESKRTVRGTEFEGETSFGDYKEIGGVTWPFSIESGAKGRPEKQKITIEKVEVNLPMDDNRFKMPEVKPADPVKPEPKSPVSDSAR